ncbi:MAG: sensor histidine kinase [Actinomycetes bacterium]
MSHDASVLAGSWTRWVALAGAAAVSAVVTAVVVVADVAVVTDASAAHVALDSVAATIGLLLAFLVYGRFRQSHSSRDLLLCAALLVLGGSNALLSVLPVVAGEPTGQSTAAAFAGVCAAGLFAAAVWLRPAVVDEAQRSLAPYRLALLLVTALGVSYGAGILLERDGLASADTFGATNDGFLSAAQVVAASAFLLAAVGWCRPAVRGDSIAGSLAVAAVFGGASRIGFAIASSTDSALVTAATVLRMAFYLTLVASSVVEIRGYWQKVAEVAALEERRRIARDLHDGLAQELAFTATQARALADRSEHPTRARLVAAAAERALDESRRAIAALTRPLDEPLEVSVAQCAEEVCDRFGAALVLDVQPDVAASADTREALLRILREAVSNAVRHGRATSVTVHLSGPAPVRLCVEDDGAGFDPSDLRHLSGRFGLISMRERAEGLGGTFSLASRSPGGTRVEVVLP